VLREVADHRPGLHAQQRRSEETHHVAHARHAGEARHPADRTECGQVGLVVLVVADGLHRLAER
jgi:hypothetical protein